MRKNARNTGKPFENEIKITCEEYNRLHLARIRKVDPPCIVTGAGKKRKVVFKKNPFLDFTGVYKNGLRCDIEAKSTEDARLPLNKEDEGLRRSQVDALREWHAAGSTTGVLWVLYPARRCVWFPAASVLAAVDAKKKSLSWENGLSVSPGKGLLLWDFLPVIEATR